MTDTTDMAKALKEINDGFALLAKGFTSVFQRMAEATAAREKPTECEDTRTCTFVEAGKMLGVSENTIRRRCDAGEIEYIQDPRSGYRRVVVRSIRDYHRRLKEETMRMRNAA